MSKITKNEILLHQDFTCISIFFYFFYVMQFYSDELHIELFHTSDVYRGLIKHKILLYGEIFIAHIKHGSNYFTLHRSD